MPTHAKSRPLPLPRGQRWDHLELLERIDASGAIASAATQMGMRYKAAWQAVVMNDFESYYQLIRMVRHENQRT